jgi:hypothetical protein
MPLWAEQEAPWVSRRRVNFAYDWVAMAAGWSSSARAMLLSGRLLRRVANKTLRVVVPLNGGIIQIPAVAFLALCTLLSSRCGHSTEASRGQLANGGTTWVGNRGATITERLITDPLAPFAAIGVPQSDQFALV